MKNEVYEADYRRKSNPDEIPDVFDIAVETGFFKTFNDIMRSIPKVIVPEDKKNYEELLQKLDALAKRRGGTIRGIVSYEKFDSHIYITLPFFEFSHEEEHKLLAELESKAHSLTFTVTDDGMIQLSVMINYFEEIGGTDNVFDMALEGNEKLTAALIESMEKRRQSIVEHPVVGKMIERASQNMGITVDEYMDRVFADDGSDPNEQIELLGALLEANEELSDIEE